jgi:hypothetical protein
MSEINNSNFHQHISNTDFCNLPDVIGKRFESKNCFLKMNFVRYIFRKLLGKGSFGLWFFM